MFLLDLLLALLLTSGYSDAWIASMFSEEMGTEVFLGDIGEL
jgi:hypothetical protein